MPSMLVYLIFLDRKPSLLSRISFWFLIKKSLETGIEDVVVFFHDMNCFVKYHFIFVKRCYQGGRSLSALIRKTMGCCTGFEV